MDLVDAIRAGAPVSPAIVAFCRKWRLSEFALFGSVLRKDFGPASDVDVLVEFAPNAQPSLFDLVEMRYELQALFGWAADRRTRKGIAPSRNPYRRQAILNTARTIYAAA